MGCSRWTVVIGMTVMGLAALIAGPRLTAGPRTIEVLADKDNQFKIPGQKKPVIAVKAGEVIRFHITAHRGTEWDKDGAIHSFTIKDLKDEGWDVRLKEGTQDITLVAPKGPGEYVIECTVKCGDGHEEMRMKLVVTP